MKIEAADLFTKHIANSKFEDLDNKTIKNLKKFVIIDDLLATGGTAKCVADLLFSEQKEILSLIVVIELLSLKGRENLSFPVHSQLQY